ncbi:MAG: class I SAM-dependent methyltransferase [Candidatus Omnitrophica bacterium]|nr:class I SAM-dependent methyltransferase [Candidatus Omnitrophota bacterium]
MDPRWVALKKRLKQAHSIVDLGCGNNPVAGAVVGVDFYIDPKERHAGTGPVIDTAQFKQRGVEFIHTRIDGPLPFKDKQFDFAYSHHVFEHLDDPQTACRDMMRIARAGAIITPAFFAEHIFGRPYHRWLIMERGNRLLFFRKRDFEQTPFGLPPKFDKNKNSWVMDDNTNPFDMLLNDEGWYKGQEGQMPKLSKILQKHWHAHSPLLEIVFIWDNEFEWKIFDDVEK